MMMENILIAKAVLYKMPEGKNFILLLRNFIAAYTITKSKTEPTMPPDIIIKTGRLMNR